MKARILLLFPLFLFSELFSQESIFSDIPSASIEVIDINPEFCDDKCLFQLSEEKKPFSFVARFNSDIIKDSELHNLMEIYSNDIGIYYKLRFNPLGKSLEVALLMPKKIIGKYSTTTIDTILAYLFSRDIDFRFKIFDSLNEDYASLVKSVEEINNEQFHFVIAILSNKDSISALDSINVPIYIPTMTNKDLRAKSNIVFGGIDYESQINVLMSKIDEDKSDDDSSSENSNKSMIPSQTSENKGHGAVISYNDDSSLGQYLGEIVKSLNPPIFFEEVITNKMAANFSKNIEANQDILSNSNIFLNTPIVKSGLLLSQLDVSNKKPSRILSTQVNYNPVLLSLVRGNDTSNVIIANSISKTEEKLVEYGILLSSDLQYDWVNYSTALGMDLFLSDMSSEFSRYFVESFSKNQAIYNINLYKIENGNFVNFVDDVE